MSTIKPIKTKVELKVANDTPAKVTERKDGKVVQYEATVSEREIVGNDEEEVNGFESESEFDLDANEVGLPFVEEQGEEVRKTKLQVMFSHVQSAVKDDHKEDYFYAFVVRQPDGIDSRYNVPCGREMELGTFQFTSRDMFKFPIEIQKRNGNSGGLFNVSIYNQDQTPLVLYRRLKNRMFTSEIVVGMQNYSVANPIRDESINTNGNQSAGVESQIMALIEKQDERFNAMLERLNAPKEKSLLERTMEEKMMRDLISPPPPPSNGIEQMMPMMMQWLSAPAMIARMTETAFPTKPLPEQKDWLDKAAQVFEMPVTQQLLGKLGDIGEAIAISRLPPIQNPSPNNDDEELDEKDDMQILLETVIEELESDRPLDKDNPTIKELRADFSDQFDDLQTTCQTLPFDSVFALLVNKSTKMQPSPFVPFLDIEATKAANKYVWNERGNKLIERLTEFYEYVKVAE